MSRHTPTTAVLLLALLAGGCVPALHQNKAREVDFSLPAAYADAAPDQTDIGQMTPAKVFEDPALEALIDEAIQNNQELGILGQEIVISQAEARITRGEFLPKLRLGGHAGMEKVGEHTSQGAADAITEIAEGKPTPEWLGDLGVGFRTSWEVDVWNKLRSANQAARRRALASVEGRNFVQTQLVAEVASSYYELLALDNQLAAVDANVQILSDSLDIVKLQKDAARVSQLAVQRFEAELMKSRSHRWHLQQEIVQTENRINFLVGRMPQTVERSSEGFEKRPVGGLGVGVPATLLENRPDVRRAELELQAAKLDVTSARAAFYPQLGIDADLGFESFSSATLIETPESLLVGVAAGAMAPLINRAELRGEYEAANARQQGAVLQYERTLLSAYTEVVTQQARLDNLSRSFDQKAEQVAMLEQAIDTSMGLFQSARADYLEVLTTRRDALESQIELYETKQQQMNAKVALYQALGGGWRSADGNSQ